MTKKFSYFILAFTFSTQIYGLKKQQGLDCPIINGSFRNCRIDDDPDSTKARLNCPAYRTFHFLQAGWRLRALVEEYGLDPLRNSEGLSIAQFPKEEDVILYAQYRFADLKFQDCLETNSLPDIQSILMSKYESDFNLGKFNLSLASNKLRNNYLYTFKQKEKNNQVVWVKQDHSQNISLVKRSFCDKQTLIIETDEYKKFNQFSNQKITYRYKEETKQLLASYQLIGHEEVINFNFTCEGHVKKDLITPLPSKKIKPVN